MPSCLPQPLTINIIGCGRLGKTLARLWHKHGVLEIGGIYNRSLASSQLACNFIGAGLACKQLKQMPTAQLWLIATPDSAITTTAQQLSQQLNFSAQAIIFHCSGSLTSAALAPLGQQTTLLASAHPVHSFADPQRSQDSFIGSYCALQGNSDALQTLTLLFSRIGAHTFEVHIDNKPLYHAATVVASNYLVSLLELAISMLEQAGLSRCQARDLIAPIAAQTAANTCAKDAIAALTGPISRGDVNTISTHLQALENQNSAWLDFYKTLGQATLKISAQQGQASDDAIAKIKALLS